MTRPVRGALAAMIAVATALWAALALARLQTVHHQTYDLAIYARMAWGMLHLELWEPIVGGTFLGGHMPFVLLPLAIVGEVFGTAPTLLVAQAACIALAAWPLARIAQRRAGNLGALALAAAWLLYPNLGHVATYEMHPGTLAVLPLCWALDALDRGDARLLVWMCIAAVACRASLSLTTAMIGLVAWLWRTGRVRTTAMWLGIGSLVHFALWLLLLRPAFGGGLPGSMQAHYGAWGGSPFGIVFADPSLVLAHFAAPERLAYPLSIAAPLALLPLLRPRWLLIAAPTLALNLISTFPTSTELYSHYLTPALPAIVAAAALALERTSRTGAVLLLAGSLGASVLAGGMPWSLDFERDAFVADARTSERWAALHAIPAGASVQAPDPLLPHLARRARVHRAPPPERQTDFVVLDVSHRARYAGREDLLRTTEEPYVRSFLARRDHAILHAGKELVVLARNRRPREGLIKRYFIAPSNAPAIRLSECLRVYDALLGPHSLVLSLRVHANCPNDLALRLGADALPKRVDLLFDGVLSPALLRPGDHVASQHLLTPAERAAIVQRGLVVGLLRSSGARPEPRDPRAIRIPVRVQD